MADRRLAKVHARARRELHGLGEGAELRPEEFLPNLTAVAERRPWLWIGVGAFTGVLLGAGLGRGRRRPATGVARGLASWVSLARVAAPFWPSSNGPAEPFGGSSGPPEAEDVS